MIRKLFLFICRRDKHEFRKVGNFKNSNISNSLRTKYHYFFNLCLGCPTGDPML